ncbi:M4 family metallopeptidase [Actinoplanes sp. NPDC051861]|uniref:M4 family metallopeptidase n=1 Tax=Actinoplanes sp. NPDC051861 TaxID=3155170 RepID=UPI003429BFD2
MTPAVTPTKAAKNARTQIKQNAVAVKAAPGEKYKAVDTVVEPSGDQHVRFHRTYQDLPVLGGDFVVHSTAAGRFTGATVAQQQEIDVSTTAEISRARAVEIAGGGTARKVVDAFAGKPALAWEVTDGDHVVIVDATTGTIRRDFDLVDAAESGTGHGLHNGDVPLSTTKRDDGSYALIDPDRGGNTVRDALNEDNFANPAKFAEFTDADNEWGDGGRADRATDAADVLYGMAKTWDYLRETFGRSGIAGDGKGITAYVHNDRNEANASWANSCQCVRFGDGSPAGKPFTSLDVVGHEVAHGLDYKTANLLNSGESGGLSESTADIFGTLVEFWANNPADKPDYLIGEKTETRAPALRRMDEPSLDGKSASCWSPTVKSLDEHYSSGISNKFFYTLAVGSGVTEWGDSPPCGDAAPVTGIGNDRAAQIWYRALTLYMVSNTNFSLARDATLQAATDLYGPDSTERAAVNGAWLAVGVDGSDPSYGVPQIDPLEEDFLKPRIGDAVSIQVTAKDPQRQQVTFSATGLPTGVTIDASGLISGAPTDRNLYSSSVIATDPDGNSSKVGIFWVVKGPPVVLSAPPAMNMQIGLGSGGFGNFRAYITDYMDYLDGAGTKLTFTAQDLPPGIDLGTPDRKSDGRYEIPIWGVPGSPGSGTTVLTATDVDGESVTVSIPWQILPANAPRAAATLTVTGGSGTATVEWTKEPYTNGDIEVSGWKVRVSPGAETTVEARTLSHQLTGLDARKTYTIGVRPTTKNGDGPEKTVTITPTGLPLYVSPGAVTWGKPVTLSGRVMRGGTTTIAGAVATLEQRPAGRSTWSRVATVKTDAKGVWRTTVKPALSTAYRVTYTGSSGMWPATSAAPVAWVRHAVSIKASTTKPKANKKIKISGTAKPARKGVKVTLQRKSGSRWVTITSTKTAASGAYSFSRSFKRGTWTLRVVVAGNTYNATATSTSVKLKVK